MKNGPWVLISGGFHQNGGMDKANLALAQFLTRQKRTVHIVSHSADKVISDNPFVKLHLVKRPLKSFILGSPALSLAGQRVARRITSQFPAAKVVVNGSNCPWPDINWSHYIHHAWPATLQGENYLYKKARATVYRIEKAREKVAYNRARVVIANSYATRRNIIEYLAINPDRVKVVYLGCEPTWLPATPDEHRRARQACQSSAQPYSATFLGALGADQRKGMDTLFDAWRILCIDKEWDVDLSVVGGGSDLGKLQARINEAGLRSRIETLGFRTDVRQILSASDLLVSPARYEPYGLNVQEAICCGIPAIVSASAGIAERYPDELKPFLLTDPEDVNDLIKRLRLWRANIPQWKEKFEPFGASLRANTWEAMAQEFVSVADEGSGGSHTGNLERA